MDDEVPTTTRIPAPVKKRRRHCAPELKAQLLNEMDQEAIYSVA